MSCSAMPSRSRRFGRIGAASQNLSPLQPGAPCDPEDGGPDRRRPVPPLRPRRRRGLPPDSALPGHEAMLSLPGADRIEIPSG